MGWSGEYMAEKPRDLKEWAKREFSFEHFSGEWNDRKPTGGRTTVLDVGRVGSTLYIASQYTPGEGDSIHFPHVYGMVVLTRWSKKEREFMHKEITETMGPCDKECPARILKLLTPAEEIVRLATEAGDTYMVARYSPGPDAYALNWRQGCVENAENKTARARFQEGDTVKLAHVVRYNNGAEIEIVKLERHPNKKRGWVHRVITTSGFCTTYGVTPKMLEGGTRL